MKSSLPVRSRQPVKSMIRTLAWFAPLLVAPALGAEPTLAQGVSAPALDAPAEEQALTNAQVLALLEAGLPAGVLAAKIAVAPEARFDTSTETLIALSQAGVDAAVLTAMVQRAARADASRTNFHDTPCQTPGMFLERDDAVQALESAAPARLLSAGAATQVANTAIRAATRFYVPGLIPGKTKITLRGAAAAFRITESKPTFLLCMVEIPGGADPAEATPPTLDPNGMQLVALGVRKRNDERVFNVGKDRFLGGTELGIPAKQLREVAFSEVKPGVYRVRPKQPLAAGEYGFYYGAAATGSPTQMWVSGGLGGRVFAFGVD